MTQAERTVREGLGADARSSVLPAPSRPRSPLRAILAAFDVLAVGAGWALALEVSSVPLDASLIVPLAVVVVTTWACMVQLSLYVTTVSVQRRVAYPRLAVAAAGGALAAAFVLPAGAGRADVLRTGTALAFLSLCLARRVFESWVGHRRARGRYGRPVLIVGAEGEAAAVVRFLELNPELGLHPCGRVGSDGPGDDPALPWFGGVDRAGNAADATAATGAIVLCNGISSDELHCIVRDLGQRGVHVHLSNGLLGLEYHRLRPVPLAQESFVYVQPVAPSGLELAAKYVVDVVVAFVALVVSLPLLLAGAIAVKLNDGGPVLFRQTRVGRDGRLITVHKLRTMVVDAEAHLDDVRHLNERDGPLFKIARDPRVTRVGRFLRASSIDELPQLVDVLRGDMSLVGPRPALPEEVAAFGDDHVIRSRVRPGLTGLWQVKSRDKAAFESYQRLDRFYVENWSLGLDLSILASTVVVVITRAFGALRSRSARPLDATAAPVLVAATVTDLPTGGIEQ